jgi:hypothetical protein
MVKLLTLPQSPEEVAIATLPFAVEYSAQHFSCTSCTSEDFSLNAPNFIFTGENGVANFTFPPLSGRELSSFSLFFSTSASFPCTVIFDHIPGFQVTASVIDGSNVSLLFQADPELLIFMGQKSSANLLSVSLNITQLDILAEGILASASQCN